MIRHRMKLFSKKVFDGTDTELMSSGITVSLELYDYKVGLKDIVPINNIASVSSELDADEISSCLGLKKTSLGEVLIYHGSMQGLKLTYCLLSGKTKNKLAVMSYGEYQPGRFICILEGVIDL
ncbi:hypothetical protein PVT67_00405 [Gallaecimonas kandeliae]|uniref:hypothetical protein n=1 Tax=Gallaecimonas kandeliae TaxID=3029055 RepID=UPI002649E514|nr:hypothetical protein [Gallaecimonas kandeliae]WKE65752.1 hypothetical protein PVT67_00405 [Gallaecimonas kandeliae]